MSGIERWLRQIPNSLTLIRIALAVPLVYCLMTSRYDFALLILFVAGSSDVVDGYLARRFNWRSRFGSIADPVADKVLLLATYIALGLAGQMNGWVVSAVVIRDIGIFSGALFYWYRISHYQGSPTRISKLCTFSMILMGLLILADLAWERMTLPVLLVTVLQCLVVVLCVVSLGQYVWKGVRDWQQKTASESSGNERD